MTGGGCMCGRFLLRPFGFSGPLSCRYNIFALVGGQWDAGPGSEG